MQVDGTVECPECGTDIDGTDWDGYKPVVTDESFTFQGQPAGRNYPYVVCENCGEEVVV